MIVIVVVECVIGCFCIGSGKTAAFLVPILTQIYINGPQANNAAAPKPAVSLSHCILLTLNSFEVITFNNNFIDLLIE